MKQSPRARGAGVDCPVPAWSAVGMFLLVFALSEGRPTAGTTRCRNLVVLGVRGAGARPAGVDRAAAMVLAIAVLTLFVFGREAKERRQNNPLFEFGQLRHKRFR